MTKCFCAHSSAILVFINDKHQNNPLMSAETVHHESTHIILYIIGLLDFHLSKSFWIELSALYCHISNPWSELFLTSEIWRWYGVFLWRISVIWKCWDRHVCNIMSNRFLKQTGFLLLLIQTEEFTRNFTEPNQSHVIGTFSKFHNVDELKI